MWINFLAFNGNFYYAPDAEIIFHSTGTIHFAHQATQEEALGDADFPAVCEDTYWSDDMVIIQVPEEFNLEEEPTTLRTGLYDLWVVRAEDGKSSDFVGFTVMEGNAGPSVCAIDPVSGPVGTEVVVYGERFG